jgi:hypothetical protein
MRTPPGTAEGWEDVDDDEEEEEEEEHAPAQLPGR